MEILLNKQIRKLRKEKGTTQEDLASYLGITVQAVSKWERAEGYPDITLLPAIAAYFQVSIDDLLGVGMIEKEKKITAYRENGMALFRAGKNAERVALWREAKQEFPNDLSVIFELMYALQAEGRKDNADEIIEYGERILNESTDNALRGGAIQSLCFIFYEIGDIEAAKKYAQMANTYYVTVNQMMPRLLNGEEAVEYCQSNIQTLVELIGFNTNEIIRKGDYSPQEAIQAYEFAIACYRLLYSDDNCGFYHCRLSEFFEKTAIEYLKLGKETEMFTCLEKATEHAIRFDSEKEGMFTAFMVNRVKMSSIDAVKNYTDYQSGLLFKSLTGKRFAQYQNDARMQKMIEKLKSVAVMS